MRWPAAAGWHLPARSFPTPQMVCSHLGTQRCQRIPLSGGKEGAHRGASAYHLVEVPANTGKQTDEKKLRTAGSAAWGTAASASAASAVPNSFHRQHTDGRLQSLAQLVHSSAWNVCKCQRQRFCSAADRRGQLSAVQRNSHCLQATALKPRGVCEARQPTHLHTISSSTAEADRSANRAAGADRNAHIKSSRSQSRSYRPQNTHQESGWRRNGNREGRTRAVQSTESTSKSTKFVQ
jgi:hypothetical protein